MPVSHNHNIEVYQEELPREWDDYVQSSPRGTWYHGSRWKRLVEEVFGHESFYLAISRGGKVAGILPMSLVRSRLFGRILVSAPYACYGGICADDPQAELGLLSEAKRLAERLRVRYLELRSVESSAPAEGFGTKTSKQTFWLALDLGPEKVWTGMDPEIRSKIRRSLAAGCAVDVGGEELVEDFYFVFSRRMRELGTPVYTKSLFTQLLRLYGRGAAVIRIRSGRASIGAGVVVFDRDRAEVPWSASLSGSFRLFPNHLLFWKAICAALERGCRRFDFGTSQEGSGPASFKLLWGARPIRLHWQYYLVRNRVLPDLTPQNKRFSKAIRLWRRMPLWLTNWLGPRLTRGIP